MKNPKESPCVSVEYGYTSDEVREAVEHIKRVRLSKKLLESFQNTSPFVIKNGEVFIKDAFISGTIHAARIETPQTDTGTYNINIGKLGGNEPHQNTVTFTADKLGTYAAGLCMGVEKSGKKACAKDIVIFGETLNNLVRDVIRNEMKPGGMLCGLKR